MTFSRPRIAAVVALVLLLIVGVSGVVLARGGDDAQQPVAAAGAGARLGGGAVAAPSATAPSPAPTTATPATSSSTGSPAPTAAATATKKATTASSSSKSAAAAGGSAVRSAKKGASTWKADGMKAALTGSGVSWFYNWGPQPNGVQAPAGVEYVPMIWGANSATDATLATAKRNGKVLLGFNEPDLAGQAQMSVGEALDLWPKLQATGMRLGSPAVAYGADTDGGWLDQFMTGAKQRNLRVDFITLHWYGSDFRAGPATAQLKSYIAATYAKYHKPIWLTEYALMSFSGGDKYPSAQVQADFVTRSTAMLGGLSYLERYAWFSTPTPDEGGDGTGLYRPDGTWTAPGKAYRKA